MLDTFAKRPMAMIVSSLVAIISGMLGLVVCFSVLALSSQGALSSFPVLKGIVDGMGNSAIMLGALAIILSLLHVFAGGWLWSSQRIGGLLGLVLAAIDMVLYGLVLFIPALVYLLTPTLVIGALLSVTLLNGWKNLQ